MNTAHPPAVNIAPGEYEAERHDTLHANFPAFATASRGKLFRTPYLPTQTRPGLTGVIHALDASPAGRRPAVPLPKQPNTYG